MKIHTKVLYLFFFGLLVIGCSKDDGPGLPEYGEIKLVAEFENPDPEENFNLAVTAYPFLESESVVTYQNDGTSQPNRYSKFIEGLESNQLTHTFSSKDVSGILYALTYTNETEVKNSVKFTVYLDGEIVHTNETGYEPGEVKTPTYGWAIKDGFSQN